MRAKNLLYVAAGLAGFLLGLEVVIGGLQSPVKVKPSIPTAVQTNSISATALPEPSLNWSTIESTNYFQYISHLRDIGCPPETICVIIKCELDKLFTERWKQNQKTISEQGNWKGVPPAWIFRYREKKEIARYETEKSALLNKLLGTEGRCGCEETVSPGDRMTFVTQEKQNKVDLLLSQFEQVEKQMDEEADIAEDKADAMRRRLALIAQKRQALLEVLSTEEMKQLELTVSPRAAYLRQWLFGFQPSKDEFQAIYEFNGEVQNLYVYSRMSNQTPEEAAQKRADLEAKLKSTVGAERYAQYQLQNNNDYRFLGMLGQFGQWDPATLKAAQSVLQENIETEVGKNPTIELRRITTQRDDQMRAILGDDKFEVFRKEVRPLPMELFNRPSRNPSPNPFVHSPQLDPTVFQYW